MVNYDFGLLHVCTVEFIFFSFSYNLNLVAAIVNSITYFAQDSYTCLLFCVVTCCLHFILMSLLIMLCKLFSLQNYILAFFFFRIYFHFLIINNDQTDVSVLSGSVLCMFHSDVL